MSHDSTDDTVEHIGKVAQRITEMVENLYERSSKHDMSKLESPEKEGFDALGENVPEYGTDAYREHMKRHQHTIEAHYAANSHHPEHYEDGVKGMSLLDILEMLADWKAAGERTPNGNIRRSLEINRERFGIDDQLYSILVNTVEELGW